MEIDGKTYAVLPSEFQKKPNPMYSTLVMVDRLGEFDRLASLVTELANMVNCKNVVFGAPTHGGYIAFHSSIENIFLFDCDPIHQQNIIANGGRFTFITSLDYLSKIPYILCVESYNSKYDDFVSRCNPIIISDKPAHPGYLKYNLSNTKWMVLIPMQLSASLLIIGDTLHYDNLINLCVMVKNGGDEFVSMLESNLPFIDRWTILDTGSTDNTVENVKRVMAGKKGALYQEPFINFGVSRNRCLELAGTQCTYNIMLDDTYHLKADVREFLQCVRGDIYADSFSLYITQNDIAYASNRIFKSKKGLKYKYAIHEVIQEEDNVNVIIPREKAYIYDAPSDKLNLRTANRKQQDLDMLCQEIETNPDDTRPYYYMAQTYVGMNKMEEAYDWFMKRINHPKSGFQQEKHEACLEAGRISQFILKKDSSEYLKWYEMAVEVDNERPDAMYYLGAHYLTNGNDVKKAFSYLKRGFLLGYPEHRQYCLKPSITYTQIPKLLTTCCYEIGEYLVGKEASDFYLKHNKVSNEPDQTFHEMMISWNKIFDLLVYSSKLESTSVVTKQHYPDVPVCCIIAPCGLYNWRGSDILTKGMGGSESFTVEMANQIHRNGRYNVVVFCNCEQEETFNGVRYIPLVHLFGVLQTHFINTCIISRYSEYLPLVMKYDVENVYLMAHDVAFSGNVIPLDRKMKGVFCLSPWHASHIGSLYPDLKNAVKLVGHGVHLELLDTTATNKIPYKFIYTSLANRGLRELLMMWPKIIAWNSSATLHIYSDINSSFMSISFPALMEDIRGLLNSPNVFYHGYVSKRIMHESWKTADVWFYPTAFSETFCVSALEAAASKTLVVATDLAGLRHTVGDRGILFDPMATQEDVIRVLINTLQNTELKERLIARNYEWAKTNTWVSQASQMENHLLVHKFEFRDKYTWTKDPIKKEIMIQTMKDNAPNCHSILVIGDQCGISLIAMTYEIKNAKYIVLDKWNDSIKRSFYTNIMNAGIKDQTMALDMETRLGLMELYKRENMFDAIYVNTPSVDMELYSELALAWELLNPNGILIIDHLLEKAIAQFIKEKEKKVIRQDAIIVLRREL